MQERPPRRRRPRPLPDAPVEGLLGRSGELAKGWLIALVEESPLASADRIKIPELTVDGPRLCERVLRAVADDGQLRRLEPGGDGEALAARVGAIAGAGSPEAVSVAVDCMRSVLWAALREEFSDPSADQLFELGERLALVTELVRRAALRSAPEQVDLPSVESHSAVEAVWQQLLAANVSSAQREGTALALLVVELDDVDRLLAVAPPEEASTVLGAFDEAVWATAGEQHGEVLSESGRAWVIAGGLERSAARTLAARVAAAVRSAEPWRGAPLKANVGVAMLGEDGEDAPGLLAAAEEARFLAQGSGLDTAG
jgi:hypothetical protein